MSSYQGNAPLVLGPGQLKDLRDGKGDLAVLDASWHMPNSPRKALKEYTEKAIPGAQYLDLDEVASPHELGLKHMMPSGEVFAKACERFGISPSTHVVIYDSHGVFSSPRALFMFRAFGHNRSSILDGGLPNWEAQGYSTLPATQIEVPQPTTYTVPQLDADTIRSYEQMVSNATSEPSTAAAELVLDARSGGRFLGTDPEPRPGLSSGHIPYSRSLPFSDFLEKHSYTPPGQSTPVTFTTLVSNERMLAALEKALGPEYTRDVLAGKRSVIASCGSGMTAGVIWLALQVLGAQKVSIYDESWTGYASRPESKIIKGE